MEEPKAEVKLNRIKEDRFAKLRKKLIVIEENKKREQVSK